MTNKISKTWEERFDKLWQKEFSAPTSNENEFVCLDNKWVKVFIHSLLSQARKEGLKKLKNKEEKMKVRLYERAAECHIVNKYGTWRFLVYRNKITGQEHVILISVKADFSRPLFMRVHSSCVTGDIFCGKECDCRQQLEMAMREAGKKNGAVFYLFQEGRNIGLTNKIRAYALKERGFDTVEANEALGLPAENRTYEMVGEMLEDLGVRSVELMTNNPDKIQAIEDMGIKVVHTIPAESKVNPYNKGYLYTKKSRMNHKLKSDELKEAKVHERNGTVSSQA